MRVMYMKRIIMYGIVAILCLSVLQISMSASAEKKTVTIQPGLTYDVEYLDLNISDKLIWNWSVDQYAVDFWLEDFEGNDSYYKVFDKTADIGSYVVPVKGLWKLVWENTEEYSASYDMSLLLTYNVSMEPRNLPPVASISVDTDKGPAPLTVSFTGAGDDTDGTVVSYAWDFGDGSKSNDQNPTHTYNNAGTYTAVLNVTDDDGAHGEADVVITVEKDVDPAELPVAAIDTDKTTGDAPLTVAFTGTGTVTGATIVSYSWDFGDGTPTSSDQNPTHTFNVADTYTVTLTVTDSRGKIGTADVTITVTEPASQNNVLGLNCGSFLWMDGFTINWANLLFGLPTRGTLSATTNGEGVAAFDVPVPYGTYDWTLDKTIDGETYSILDGTIEIDENTPSGETWWPADQLDSLVSPMTEEEWEELNDLGGEEPVVVEETFEENVTEEVVVGDEKVEVTVSEVENDTVTAKVGEEEVEIKKDEPIRVDSDGDGVDDVEITYVGEDENGQPILKFEDVDVDKKSEAGTSPFPIVGIIIGILVLLIVIFIFIKKKKD